MTSPSAAEVRAPQVEHDLANFQQFIRSARGTYFLHSDDFKRNFGFRLIDALEASHADLVRLKQERDALKLEAQIHAGEARAANSTIYEIYQVLSGSTGEPGTWNGAEPARQFVAAAQERIAELEGALKPFAEAGDIFEARATVQVQVDDDPVHSWTHHKVGTRTITVGDFRIARATLSPAVKEPK